MWKQILDIMAPFKDEVSFYSRMETMHELFERHGLYEEMWPPQPDVPLSIVFAVSHMLPEFFEQQVGTLLQIPGLLRPDDQLIFVVDQNRKLDALNVIRSARDRCDTKVVVVSRGQPGDRATFNWDIGLAQAKHDRVLFVRDACLMFQPCDLLSQARSVDIKDRLVNFSVVLGPTWSRFVHRWIYVLHPRYAPNPLLFSFVTSKESLESIGGFDQVFRRGYDHLGEMDMLLRWNMKGYVYEISDKATVLYPGMLPRTQEELAEMQFQSAIPRRYFYDRYGEGFIQSLQAPYRLETPPIEVHHALTLDPLSEYIVEDKYVVEPFEPVKDAFDFAKRPNEDFIVEEV